MATINGTFNSLISGTLSGTVATPGATGPAGPTGPTGATGPAGAPGVGVPAGGTAGQFLTKTTTGVDYATGWTTLSLSDYLTKAGNLAGLTNLSTARDNLNLGTLNTPTFVGVTAQGSGANVGQFTSTALTLNHTGYGQFTIQPSSGITFPDASVQTTAFPAGSDVPTGGLTGMALVKLSNSNYDADWATIAGLPTGGTVGQVLTKNSGTNYDSSWQTLIPGDRYLSTSTTSNTIGNGNKTFTIGTGLSYTPTQSITISYDASNHMHGEVLTYNSGTGVLTVDINHHTGSGTYASWVVNVGGDVPAASVAWGSITGTLGSQTDLATALNAKLATADAATTYQTLSGMSDYLSKAGNLSGLADTGTSRSNLGLGTLAVVDDAPSDGSQYARKNGAWDVVSGGGASLPAVQIAASAINPARLTFGPSPQCIALTYPSHTDVLNGLYAVTLFYSNDASGTPSLILSGLTSLVSATFNNNAAMTTAPDISGLTSLSYVYVTNCDALTSPPDFTGLTGLISVEITGNDAMTTAPDFTGLTSLNSVLVGSNNVMTSPPDFTDCSALGTVTIVGNAAMTTAPDFTDCTSLNSVNISYQTSMATTPDFTGVTSLTNVTLSNNDAMTTAPDFTSCTSLYSVEIVANTAMTTAPDFSGLTALDTAQIYYNSVMTSAPDFTGCTALVSVNVSNNVAMASAPDFTDCSALSNVTVAECDISDTNLLTMCAQIYAAGAVSGTLAMEGGTNGSFDGQNLPTEITDLQGAGWSVSFNDNNPL